MSKHNEHNNKTDNKNDQGHETDAPLTEGKEKNNQEKSESVDISRAEYDLLKGKEKEAAENYDRLLRLQAEFENVRKRLERDKCEYAKFANEELICELIPFVDDFQRAFEAADKTKDFNVLHKGVEMILNHLLELLKSKGVSLIEAKGKLFDPSCHEALMQVDSQEHPENTVVEELQKGYILNKRVLRTAKVKVAKQKEAKQPEEKEAQEKKDN